MKNSGYKALGVIVIAMFIVACKTSSKAEKDKVQVVNNLDLKRYMGKWYEIARIPVPIGKGWVNTSDNYTLLNNGKVNVVYEGFKNNPSGKVKTFKSYNVVPDPSMPSIMRTHFYGIFRSDYNVIALDKDYEYAMVSGNGKGHLWILSRHQSMPEETYKALVVKAAKMGFETYKLERAVQVPN